MLTCVVNSKILLCFGNNQYGNAKVPINMLKADYVSAGKFHTCALKYTNNKSDKSKSDEIITNSGGKLACWGLNDVNQTTIPNNWDDGIVKVVQGKQHTCAVKGEVGNRELKCWGEEKMVHVPEQYRYGVKDVVS